MQKNKYKLVFDEYNSHNQQGYKTYEGEFESFEEFMHVCEEYEAHEDDNNYEKFGLKVKRKHPKGFHYAGGFYTDYLAFENGAPVSKDIVDSLIW
jgi:hypothetical protein